jgi:hypothetical protein
MDRVQQRLSGRAAIEHAATRERMAVTPPVASDAA